MTRVDCKSSEDIKLSKEWAHSLLHQMNFVQQTGTTVKSRLTNENFLQQKRQFLADLLAIVEIPGELILNWDQLALKWMGTQWSKKVRNELR